MEIMAPEKQTTNQQHHHPIIKVRHISENVQMQQDASVLLACLKKKIERKKEKDI